MTISSTERTELLEHLRDRPDIWTELPNGLWARSVDARALCAVVISPSEDMFDIRIVPAGWSSSTCDGYLQGLLAHWTSYGQRIRIQKFLEGHYQEIVDGTADSAAHQLIEILHSDSWDPENAPFQLSLPADIAGPEAVTTFPKEIQFRLVGGGWIRLVPQTSAFQITLSARLHKDYGGGYASHLTGYVRPSDGRIKQAAAMLSGAVIEKEETSTQLPLPIE